MVPPRRLSRHKAVALRRSGCGAEVPPPEQKGPMPMGVKHINAAKQAASQKAQQSKARREKQRAKGAKGFKHGSNPHHGASLGQSGQGGGRRR